MDLNTVNIVIRPRSAFEGLDLGFVMASRWFLTLWGLWLVTALPLVILVHGLCFKWPGLALLIIWWLKPVFETPLLYWLSRKIFGTPPDIRTMVTSMVSILRPRLVSRLTVRRFSPSRSFYMPVLLLENMKGKDYSRRTSVLGHNQNAGFTLTFICSLFEGMLFVSAYLLIVMLVPDELASLNYFDLMHSESFLALMLQNSVVIACMSVIAPFYIAAGFALYLTRRTQLEAWDIELNFKRLVARKKERASRTFGILALCVVFLITALPMAQASGITKDDSRKIIGELLKHEDFGQKKTVTLWKLKSFKTEEEPAKPFAFGDFFAALGRLVTLLMKPVLWTAGGILFVLFVYVLLKHLDLFSKGVTAKASGPPDELFGLKLTPDSLPADIVAGVRALLGDNDVRGALSLLYRGTLYRLMAEDRVDIPASATEGECVIRVERAGSPDRAVFFRDLTRLWITMAYGHIRPEREAIDALCVAWSQFWPRDRKAGS